MRSQNNIFIHMHTKQKKDPHKITTMNIISRQSKITEFTRIKYFAEIFIIVEMSEHFFVALATNPKTNPVCVRWFTSSKGEKHSLEVIYANGFSCFRLSEHIPPLLWLWLWLFLFRFLSLLPHFSDNLSIFWVCVFVDWIQIFNICHFSDIEFKWLWFHKHITMYTANIWAPI